jgi:hypothetical protein
MSIQRWFNWLFLARLNPNAATRSCPTVGAESLVMGYPDAEVFQQPEGERKRKAGREGLR